MRDRLMAALLIAILTAVFIVTPWHTGDWEVFRNASRAALTLDDPYSTDHEGRLYYNPPWLAWSFIPLAALPVRLGWAILSAVSVVGAIGLLERWGRGTPPRVALLILSPPLLYTIMYGQVDVWILCGFFLGASMIPAVALTKPQIALPALLRTRAWVRAGVMLAALSVLGVVLYGWWPGKILNQPQPFLEEGHNLWRGVWPWNLIPGLLILAWGAVRRDTAILIASAPFLSPYAGLNSFAGVWIVLIGRLPRLAVGLVWALAWSPIVVAAVI